MDQREIQFLRQTVAEVKKAYQRAVEQVTDKDNFILSLLQISFMLIWMNKEKSLRHEV